MAFRNDQGLGALVIVAIVAGVLVGGGLMLYLADYGIEATITGKSCNPLGTNIVHAQTRIGGIESSTEVSSSACTAIQRGNFVIYHIRSGDIEVYQREGGTRLWPPG